MKTKQYEQEEKRSKRDMIKTNEVRVGNWVMGNAPYQLTLNQIITNDLYLRQGKKGYFEPIPLTEDILLKCGFEKNNEGRFGYSYNKVVTVGDFNLKTDFRVSLDMNVVYFGKAELNILHSLHQLQNFYFSLTGKELECNL